MFVVPYLLHDTKGFTRWSQDMGLPLEDGLTADIAVTLDGCSCSASASGVATGSSGFVCDGSSVSVAGAAVATASFAVVLADVAVDASASIVFDVIGTVVVRLEAGAAVVDVAAPDEVVVEVEAGAAVVRLAE